MDKDSTEDNHNKQPAMKYALRFGKVAIDLGFLTREQLQDALIEQFSSDSSARLRPRKLIGEVLFEKGWITLSQIDQVLAEIFRSQD